MSDINSIKTGVELATLSIWAGVLAKKRSVIIQEQINLLELNARSIHSRYAKSSKKRPRNSSQGRFGLPTK